MKNLALPLPNCQLRVADFTHWQSIVKPQQSIVCQSDQNSIPDFTLDNRLLTIHNRLLATFKKPFPDFTTNNRLSRINNRLLSNVQKIFFRILIKTIDYAKSIIDYPITFKKSFPDFNQNNRLYRINNRLPDGIWKLYDNGQLQNRLHKVNNRLLISFWKIF